MDSQVASTRSRGRRLALLGGLVLVVGLAVCVPSVVRWLDRGQRMMPQDITLRNTGLAALAYLKDRGTAPQSVADLFDAGYLQREDQKASRLHRAPSDLPSGEVYSLYLDAVRIHMPPSAEGFHLGPDGLLVAPDGTRHLLLTLDCPDAVESVVIWMNKMFGEPWLNLMSHKRSGLSWVDDWSGPRGTRETDTKPTSQAGSE